MRNKKILLPGLLFITAIFSTGCLGDAEEKILGEWIYVTNIDPLQHRMHWTFIDNGDVAFYDEYTGVLDTGKYEMFMDGTHRVVKVKNTTIMDRNISMNGEWVIVRLEDDALVVGTRDYGGFQQRDLYR
jgi:hypothetical protein